MDINEKFNNLQKLTFEANMLVSIMHEVLIANEEKRGFAELCYLSEILNQKFREIRALF